MESMQDAEGEGEGERRWLLNSSSPCWDAQAERGGVHWDVRALLPGRRPVPVLALYHKKPFLLLKLGRSWNIWWNSPTGHLCDKWIKLDKVMLTAIGLCMSQIRSRRQRCFILLLNFLPRSQIVLSFIHLIFEHKQKFFEKQKLQHKDISEEQ